MKGKLEIKKLSSVCDIVSDSPKEFIGVKKYYSTGAIDNVRSPIAEEITFANRPSRANCYPKLNDVGFAKMKLTNKVILIDDFFSGSIFSTGFCFLRPKKNLNSKYLYHYLISHLFQNIKNSLAGDGIMGGIKNSDVKEIEIPLPTLPQQQRIVTIIDECFAAIDKAKANAEQNLKNSKELFESYLQSVFTNKVHGKKFDSLDNLCELIVDCEHKTAPTQETGYPSIRTPNIGKGELILENVNRVSYETYLQWTRRAIPKAGDLILAREAPAGNIAVIPENIEVCLGQRTVLLRPQKDRLISKYLAYLILSKEVQEILLSHSTGATVQHINMKDIRAFKIYNLSNLKEQISVVQKLDALRAETQKLEAMYQKKISDLEELKKSILQKAFAGELRSPEGEIYANDGYSPSIKSPERA
ncbi:MAG: restriction endonuclease subunit S [Bacteroidota bacterium]|nr:restriction endonuclease subunit S [Bacteroidota bacterium]